MVWFTIQQYSGRTSPLFELVLKTNQLRYGSSIVTIEEKYGWSIITKIWEVREKGIIYYVNAGGEIFFYKSQKISPEAIDILRGVEALGSNYEPPDLSIFGTCYDAGSIEFIFETFSISDSCIHVDLGDYRRTEVLYDMVEKLNEIITPYEFSQIGDEYVPHLRYEESKRFIPLPSSAVNTAMVYFSLLMLLLISLSMRRKMRLESKLAATATEAAPELDVLKKKIKFHSRIVIIATILFGLNTIIYFILTISIF